MTDKPQDENIKNQIMRLLEKGYTRGQLIKDFGFAERTVDAAIKAYKELGGDARREDKETTTSSSRNDALAFRKSGESVLPEWLEQDVAEIFDGEVRDQRIFLAGMSVPLMGLRLFAEGVKPIIDLMATWQKGQAEAAQASQRSGIEMAQAAGEAAAAGVGKFFMDTKPWLAASPNPMQSMLVDTMRPFFQQMMGQLMGSFMRASPQGQAGVQSPQPGQANFQQPGGVQQASEDEVKEAFND